MATRDQAHSGDRRVVVGLIADPGLPADLADHLCEHLPGELGENVSDQITWEVRVERMTLPLTDDAQLTLLRTAQEKLREHGWDMVIYLTELPRRIGARPHVFDLSVANSAALVSVPALGWVRLRSHVRSTAVDLVARMAASRLGWDDDGAEAGDRPKSKQLLTGSHEIPGHDEGVDVAVALKGLRGNTRLVTGMVRMNRPWRLVPSLSAALAAAIGVGAFGVFYSSIWEIGDALNPMRMALIGVLTIAAMVVWLIAFNSLWERRSTEVAKRQALLYNTSTAITLFIGVAVMYAVLFVLMLATALIVIASGHLESTLGHPVGFGEYVDVAWLATSMGIGAGAVGSSLESEDAVRQAAYSKRQMDHHKQRTEADAGEGS